MASLNLTTIDQKQSNNFTYPPLCEVLFTPQPDKLISLNLQLITFKLLSPDDNS